MTCETTRNPTGSLSSNMTFQGFTVAEYCAFDNLMFKSGKVSRQLEKGLVPAVGPVFGT